jgi:hypothetical protein
LGECIFGCPFNTVEIDTVCLDCPENCVTCDEFQRCLECAETFLIENFVCVSEESLEDSSSVPYAVIIVSATAGGLASMLGGSFGL